MKRKYFAQTSRINSLRCSVINKRIRLQSGHQGTMMVLRKMGGICDEGWARRINKISLKMALHAQILVWGETQKTAGNIDPNRHWKMGGAWASSQLPVGKHFNLSDGLENE